MARGGSRPHTPEVQLRRLCLVCAASLLVASAGAATVVAYRGYEYRVLDGTAPDGTYGADTERPPNTRCQREYMALPAGGWALAPDDADAVAVAAAYDWGTGCLVYADGDSTGALGNGGAATRCGTEELGPFLSQFGDSYKVTLCNRRILLRRPCAAGGYHGSTMASYAEASTATCTLCEAGRYSPASGAAAAGGCPVGCPARISGRA